LDGFLEFPDRDEPGSGLVGGVSIRRVLGLVGLCPILLCLPQRNVECFLIVCIVPDDVFLEELVLSPVFVVHRFPYLPDLTHTVVPVSPIICVLYPVTVVRFFYY
jgi:hypothetical protein